MKKIAFSALDIQDSDIEAVASVFRSGWLIQGKFSERLEELFCENLGVKYSTTVSSCTAGLHLSCIVAGFGPGDEVIVPAQTHVATAHAVEYTGAKAVFADVDSISGNILLSEIEKKINTHTKGIIPVHMAGYPCDIAKISEFCNEQNLILIEDCAHAFGTTFSGRHVGTFGITGCFSFYPTKILGAYGDGGFISTNSHKLYLKARRMRFYGIENLDNKNKFYKKYYSNEHGINSRIDEIQLSILNLKFPKVKNWIKRRREIAEIYNVELKNTSLILPKQEKGRKHVYHLYTVFHPKRDLILKKLKVKKIYPQIYYPYPIHKMKAYRNFASNNRDTLTITEKKAKGIFSLPLYPKISNYDVKKITKTIKTILKTV